MTYKVVNGEFENGTNENTVFITLLDGKGTLGDTIPTDMIPNAGYKDGAWDVEIDADTIVDGNVTYTYTFSTVKLLTVTYLDGCGGKIFASKAYNVPYGEKTPMFDGKLYRSGYLFTGWNPLVAEFVTEDAVYTAQWKKSKIPDYIRPVPKTEPDAPAITEIPELDIDEHLSYIIGYTDGCIHPEASITRAEIATVFFRLLDADTRADALCEVNLFTDVTTDDWFNTAVSTMYALNVVSGYPDGSFRPNDSITRAELTAMAVRFKGVSGIANSAFIDIGGHWAEIEILQAAADGWVFGYEDGSFKPDKIMTRAETMAVINRALDRNPDSVYDLLPDMIGWPDNMDLEAWYYLDVQEATNSHEYVRNADGTETWYDLLPNPDWTRYEY